MSFFKIIFITLYSAEIVAWRRCSLKSSDWNMTFSASTFLMTKSIKAQMGFVRGSLSLLRINSARSRSPSGAETSASKKVTSDSQSVRKA